MPEPVPSPAHLFKIILPSPQLLKSSPGTVFPPAPLDVASGYIHFSTAAQTPVTAERFFADSSEIWVLKVRYAGEVKDKTRWEGVVHKEDGNAGIEYFPHVYGDFRMKDVSDVAKLTKNAQNVWVFPDGWLE
ncbi:hypothetical protein BC936DRAFT_141990 [Jimgerdemannia flammicorona]|uniref:Uncharacterized protein n=2 Tax=Jimgerdemannia flammicorona TaxID=994334 RepID=A0A433QUH7_9FUNG|nr:hypothetical protein BC936DRAFT_141990 [Jimgerdemannia flammicorona]RUS33449.1 hypothetical protein BC938DRAFT_471587 [Jimgerdemannia flammicorona]